MSIINKINNVLIVDAFKDVFQTRSVKAKFHWDQFLVTSS